MVWLCLLLILKLADAFAPTYSTYSWIYIPNGNYISTSRDGSVYSAINSNAIEYYRKINNQYTFVTKIYSICSVAANSCPTSSQIMTYDGSRILAYSGNQNTILRVYKIVNDSIIYSQAIQRSAGVNFYQVREDFLLLPSSNSFDFYKYDSTSGLYQAIVLNQVFPSTASRYAFSTDGRFVIGMTSTFTAHIYSYQGTSLSLLTSSPIPVATNFTYYSDFKIQKMNNSSYAIIIHLVNTVVSQKQKRIQYYTMSLGGVVAFASDFESLPYNVLYSGLLYFTKNARYILYSSEPSMIRLYQFNPSNSTYILTYNMTNFYQGYPSSIYVAEDATFMYGTRGEATLYYACTVPNCLTCATLGQCLVCASTFTLTISNACGCNTSQTLVNSTCVSCNPAHCSYCSSADACSVCASGFTLVGNSCICADKNTISLVDGTCVSCNVAGCYRCDQTDICSLFVSSQAGVSGSQIAALVLLVTILLIVGTALVYLMVKVRSLANNLEKVHPSQSREAFQPSQTKSKAYLNQSPGHSRDPSLQTMIKTNNSAELPQQTPLWSKWRLQPVQVQPEIVSRSQQFNQRLDHSHLRIDQSKALKKDRRISSIDDYPQQQVVSVEVIKADR